MRPLYPVGGIIDFDAGILTTPAHKGIPIGIEAGMPWGADNEAFTRGFEPERFFGWLDTMEPFKSTCLFVPVPDVVGNAIATLNQWRNWVVRFTGWPLAFVAQDGQEDFDFPHVSTWQTLFVGGSTRWKESMAAVEVIRQAQAHHKRIHIGRVNWERRYKLFSMLAGSEHFTFDGTRSRYDGVNNTIQAWRSYRQPKQPFLIKL